MRAAIFDMDGTLVSSLDLHIQAYLNVCKKHNLKMGRDFVKMRFGMTAREIFADFAAQNEFDIDAEQLAKEKFSEFDRIAQNIPLLPGAVDLLEHLRAGGIKLALASGSGRQNVDTVVSRAGLGRYFDITVAGDEVPRGKEFPDMWLKALKLLQPKKGAPIEPGECIVFEDAYYGAKSAKEAGMMVVGVLTGYTTFEGLESICDFVLNSLAEFENVFKQI